FSLSSRRRHTRFSRDWSSDVCSSDLLPRDREQGACRLRVTWVDRRTHRSCRGVRARKAPCALALRAPPCAANLLRAHRDGEFDRSEEHTSELQSRENLVCRHLLEKKT